MKQPNKTKDVSPLRDWLTAVRRQDLHHVELWNRGEQPKRLVLWFTALPDDPKAAEAEVVAAAGGDAAQAPAEAAREREKFLMNMANAYVPSVVSKYLASGPGGAPKAVEADPMYPLIGALFASFTSEQGVDVMQGKPITLREDQRLLFGQAIDRFVELQRKRATINGNGGGAANGEPHGEQPT